MQKNNIFLNVIFFCKIFLKKKYNKEKSFKIQNLYKKSHEELLSSFHLLTLFFTA